MTDPDITKIDTQKTDSKELIRELNDLNQLPEQQQSLDTTLRKVAVFYTLTNLAKKNTEKEYFLMQAISLLEALSLSAFDGDTAHEVVLNNGSNAQDGSNTQDPKKLQIITQEIYQSMQVQLAQCYVLLAEIKGESKFYDIAKKLLKPYSKNGDISVLISLITVCAYKDEPALCQFYMKKLFKLDGFELSMLADVEALQKFSKLPWYDALINDLNMK